MRKIGLIMGFAVIMATACSIENEPLVPSVEVPEGKYLFTLSANTGAPSLKSSYTSETDFYWSEDDAISVLFSDGSTNTFYTLTTKSTGNQATFTGLIDNGFTLGASDTGKKWALFPAGEHEYIVDGGSYPINFKIPAVTDYSVSHPSANIPLFAVGSPSNVFQFRHLAAAYKWSFKDLDVDKVRLVITNRQKVQLSGTFPLGVASDTEVYWWDQYADGPGQSVSYVADVDPLTKKVSFYVPCGWKSNPVGFQPDVTLKNESTGYVIYHAAADSKLTADATKPSVSRMVVFPEVSAPGYGTPFVSSFGINWSSASSISASTASGKDAIKSLKYSSSSNYVYIYAEFDESKLQNDASYENSNYWAFCIGDGVSDAIATKWTDNADTRYEGWIKAANAYAFSSWISEGPSLDKSQYFTAVNGTLYYELRITRNVAFLQGTSAKFGIYVTSAYNKSGWKGDVNDIIGTAPVDGGAMGSMTLVAYVAP